MYQCVVLIIQNVCQRTLHSHYSSFVTSFLNSGTQLDLNPRISSPSHLQFPFQFFLVESQAKEIKKQPLCTSINVSFYFLNHFFRSIKILIIFISACRSGSSGNNLFSWNSRMSSSQNIWIFVRWQYCCSLDPVLNKYSLKLGQVCIYPAY